MRDRKCCYHRNILSGPCILQPKRNDPSGGCSSHRIMLSEKISPQLRGPPPAAAGPTRALFPMLPGCSVPALRPQGLLLFKSLHLNHEFLLSPVLKPTNSLMLHPCSGNMLQFCLPELLFGKGSHPTTQGKSLDRVFLPVLHLQNLLCHLSSKASPRYCKVPSSETVT